jgi:hypothetical protein
VNSKNGSKCSISRAMLLRPAYLCQKLDRPVPTKDGGMLRTIRNACDYDRDRESTQKKPGVRR